MATKFKASNGYWYVRYKSAGGTWKTKYCGKNATASDAEIIRKQYDAEELNRCHKATVRIIDKDIYQALDYYREKEIPKSRTGRPKSFKGIQRYKAIIDNIEGWFRECNVKSYSDVTTETVRDFFDHLVYKLERSASTISKHRQVMINFFEWGIQKNYCSENPALVIKNPKRVLKKPRYFSEDELKRIFDEAQQPYSSIFRFLYLTGLRIGELGNLEWLDYDEGQKHIIIRVKEGNKTKREEVVPLNEDAVSILEEQKSIGGPKYIFVNAHGHKLDNANIYRALKNVMKTLNIENASPHTFRHTTASHLVIKGVSLYVVRDILRHASIRETEIYAHLSREAITQAVGLLRA